LGQHRSQYGQDANGNKWIATEAIRINPTIQSNKFECAATLAHEILHALWWKDYGEYWWLRTKAEPIYGMPTPTGVIRSRNSIDQEYYAFLTAYQIWSEFKKDGYDVGTSENPGYSFDIQLSNFAGSEDDGKKAVRRWYNNEDIPLIQWLTEY
jgi:hypothetical protein